LTSAAVASAQQVDDLSQQLEQLKQEYQQKIQAMEKRIGDLEAQKSSPAVAVIDKSALAEEVKNDIKGPIGSQPGALQGSLPSEPTRTDASLRRTGGNVVVTVTQASACTRQALYSQPCGTAFILSRRKAFQIHQHQESKTCY
jgi:hypothetical protein